MKKLLFNLIAISILIVTWKEESYAQAPTLGSTANFVLFTSVGAITNTGNSKFTGNIGSNSGPSTGFGNVNGQMHSGDGVTAQAAADLNTLYNQLNSAVPNFNHAPLLGNGDTLIAGVYSITGNTTLSNNLYLDAKGNSNAVFIFKIEAPLSTTAVSNVILINGAQACNVFWKVEGLISIASNTQMKGTLVANNAAINIGTGAVLEGRALSTSGAISTNQVKGFTPTGCGSTVLTGPAAPNLGTTGCYALFSGNGVLTNSGPTKVKGDVGTNVGLTTGFNPLLVNGTIHPIPDGSTSSAAADLLNVYNYLNTLPVDIELLYPAQFGQSLVLTPHTYLLNAGTALTDTLFLDAQNNANAVFVIKINGALTTSTHSQVILRNGAQAKNVYWKVDGAAGIHDFSTFVGTLVVNNAAIDITTGVNLIGRALTTNGAFTTSSDTVTISGACSSLPVSWLYFKGKPAKQEVLLEWATTSELNNSYFTIEKSHDGILFDKLTAVKSTTGVGNQIYNYSFIDNHPYNIGFYKISQTDIDGKTSYYNTIKIKMNGSVDFKASQYVQGSYIYAQTVGSVAGKGTLDLYSMDGRKVATQKVIYTEGSNTFKILKPNQTGIYLLHMEGNGVKLYSGKVIVE